MFQFASKIHISTWYIEHHRTVAAIDLFFSLSLFVLGTTHAILQGEVHVVRHTRGCLAGDMYECSVIIDSHLVESTRPSPGRGVLRLRRTYRVGKAFSITPRGSLSLSLPRVLLERPGHVVFCSPRVGVTAATMGVVVRFSVSPAASTTT